MCKTLVQQLQKKVSWQAVEGNDVDGSQGDISSNMVNGNEGNEEG